ncbi:MAG: hypothetical protein WC956_02765 [bacterium]
MQETFKKVERNSPPFKGLPQDHPASFLQDRSKAYFIFCDDSDDRFEGHYSKKTEFEQPAGLTEKNYIKWASVIVSADAAIEALDDLKYVKSHWSIPAIHCSSNEGKLFRDLLYGNDSFRKNFHEFVESFKGQYYFSSILDDEVCYQKILPSVLQGCDQIEHWDFNDHKDVSLYWHLIKLDKHLNAENNYYAFVDRVPVTAAKEIDGIGAWYGRPHNHLHKIHGLICHRTNKSRRDDISELLELSDYIASFIRRSFQKIRAQDARVMDLGSDELSNRINAIVPAAEQELVRFVLEMVRTNRFQLVDAIACGRYSDGSEIKL